MRGELRQRMLLIGDGKIGRNENIQKISQDRWGGSVIINYFISDRA